MVRRDGTVRLSSCVLPSKVRSIGTLPQHRMSGGRPTDKKLFAGYIRGVRVTASCGRPRWPDTDWETLSPILKGFQIPPAPRCPSPTDLDAWLVGSLNRLTALLKEYTPVSRPSHHSKPWWSPHLTILCGEFHKASKMARKHGTPALRDVANISKAGYFKSIKAAKNKHWLSFLLGATPQSLWTAKRFAYGRTPPRFPSLPGAETPQQMNKVLLDHFFPPKIPFSPPPRLRPYKRALPLKTEEITIALSKCSPTSAPGPDGVPDST